MSLAQEYLDNPPDLSVAVPDQLEYLKVVNDAVLSQLKLSPETFAERYVFEVDPTKIIQEQIEAGHLDAETAFDVGEENLPKVPTWIEWPTSNAKFGVVTVLSDGTFTFLVVARYNNTNAPVAICSHSKEKPWHFTWLVGGKPLEIDEPGRSVLQTIFCGIWAAFFLLSVPRACEIKEVTWDKKKQKAREKAGKLPLLELKRTIVHLGKPNARYEGGKDRRDEGGHAGRRLHRVHSFLRTYQKGRETPKVSFVDSHWRGDASLGVLLHEKVVRK